MPDNEQIGRMAAEFFRGHELQNFAFLGSNIYREFVAGEIRCAAFEAHLRKICSGPIRFEKLMLGHVESNDDCWDEPREAFVRWVKTLPLPCGVFVSGGVALAGGRKVLAGFFFDQEDCRILNGLMRDELVSYFCQFDPVTPVFDLVIRTPKAVQISVCVETAHVTGQIGPPSVRQADKARVCFLFVVEISILSSG